MNKRKGKLAAAIDIGSDAVQMRISQWDGHGIVPLDCLEKPINIGQEVFSTGYISFDTVRSLSFILDGFCDVAKGYDIARVHTVGTAALREASNRAYVLDRLSIQNNLDVDVLEDGESTALLFDAMKHSVYLPDKKTMLVFGGAGATDFALLEDDRTVCTHSMQAGLLNISEMLRETSEHTRHIDIAVGEYLKIFLARTGFMESFIKAGDIVFGMGDMQPLFRLCGEFGTVGTGNTAALRRKTLLNIYGQYRRLSVEQISARHKLGASQGRTLYAALALLASLLQMTKVDTVYCSQISLADAVLNLSLRPGARRVYNESLRTGALCCATELSARYHCDTAHARHVMDLALTLFEKLRKLHGLSRKQSLLLQAACLLHEAGYYTAAADLQEASYDLVKDARIFGLNSRETLLTANIIAPQSLLGITVGARYGSPLNGDDMLFAGKMHALLHLADALDYSRRQKAELCGVEQEENRLLLFLRSREDYALEQWMFKKSASLFQEVFGIVPQLRIENAYGMGGGL